MILFSVKIAAALSAGFRIVFILVQSCVKISHFGTNFRAFGTGLGQLFQKVVPGFLVLKNGSISIWEMLGGQVPVPEFRKLITSNIIYNIYK